MELDQKNNFEYIHLSIEGLDIREHKPKLDQYRNDGWVVFRSSPDAQNGQFKYLLKRLLSHINQ